MKKLSFIAIILIISIVPIFAEGQIGISLTPEWFWISSEGGYEYSESTGISNFMLTVDGANYFGENTGFGVFGVEYGLGMLFPRNVWIGNITVRYEDPNIGFAFRVGAGYRYEFSDFLGIAAGLGFNGSFWSENVSYNEYYSYYSSQFSINIYGKVAVDFTLLDFLRINAGLAMGGPICTLSTISIGGESETTNIHRSGFFLAPFVGVSYVY